MKKEVRDKQEPPLCQNGRFSNKGENHSSWKCQTRAQSPHSFLTGSGPFLGSDWEEMTGSLPKSQAEVPISQTSHLPAKEKACEEWPNCTEN